MVLVKIHFLQKTFLGSTINMLLMFLCLSSTCFMFVLNLMTSIWCMWSHTSIFGFKLSSFLIDKKCCWKIYYWNMHWEKLLQCGKKTCFWEQYLIIHWYALHSDSFLFTLMVTVINSTSNAHISKMHKNGFLLTKVKIDDDLSSNFVRVF